MSVQFSAQSKAPSNISETAARWYLHMRDAAVDAPEHSQFEAWLMANPMHQAEYESITETMKTLSSNEQLATLANALEQKKSQNKLARQHKVKKAMSATFATLVLGFGALFSAQQYQHWQATPTMQIAANNPIDSITTQTLDDGSQVTLSANSEMQVAYYRHQRHVQLAKGEAIFEVAKDPNRPFVVETNMAKITVLGTHFAVNQFSQFVRISVDHGRVQVEAKFPSNPQDLTKTPGPALILTNQQVAEISTTHAPALIKRNANDAFSFKTGKLVFDTADTQEVAETLSRYRQRPVIAQGQSKRDISAVIQIKDAEQFLQGLPNIAPVKVSNNATETRIISQTK